MKIDFVCWRAALQFKQQAFGMLGAHAPVSAIEAFERIAKQLGGCSKIGMRKRRQDVVVDPAQHRTQPAYVEWMW